MSMLLRSWRDQQPVGKSAKFNRMGAREVSREAPFYTPGAIIHSKKGQNRYNWVGVFLQCLLR